MTFFLSPQIWEVVEENSFFPKGTLFVLVVVTTPTANTINTFPDFPPNMEEEGSAFIIRNEGSTPSTLNKEKAEKLKLSCSPRSKDEAIRGIEAAAAILMFSI